MFSRAIRILKCFRRNPDHVDERTNWSADSPEQIGVNMPKITLDDFRASIESHATEWGLVDHTLYELCRSHHDHNDIATISAKVLFIGRGFASGLERHVRSDQTQGSPIGKMVGHLYDKRDEIDRIIDRLASLVEPLNEEMLALVVSEHGKFCQLISKISRGENKLASFASKYLHFHVPAVPIFDSYASKQAWKMRDRDTLIAFEKPAESHDGYYWYALCFFQHYRHLRAIADDITVRQAEALLLWLATRADVE